MRDGRGKVAVERGTPRLPALSHLLLTTIRVTPTMQAACIDDEGRHDGDRGWWWWVLGQVRTFPGLVALDPRPGCLNIIRER